MYAVVLEPAAQRDIRKLPKTLQDRVVKASEKLETDPRTKGVKKLTGFEHQWRLRMGEYRILYEIDDEKHLVHIYRIAHRREVYRK